MVRKKVLLLINPNSGKKNSKGQLLDVLNEFSSHNYQMEVYVSQKHKPIISYFPTGTMNDFGTNFGLTNDMLQCAKIACKENVESFDVGKMNSR